MTVFPFLGLRTSIAAGQSLAKLSPAVREFVTIDAPLVALTHVVLIDGTGGPVRRDQTIVIADGLIQRVGDASAVPLPAGAKVLDLTGHTVIPGLVGMHDHMFYPAGGAGGQRNHIYFSGPRLYLAAGVTSIRTAGTYQPYADFDLKQSIDEGRIPGPKINPSGAYIDAVRGRVQGVEDARRLVSYWADEGATSFKAYTQVTRAELGAAIGEAHQRGIKVTGHLCSVTFREAAELGIDNLEHGLQIATDFTRGKKPDECPPTRETNRALAALDMNSEPVRSLLRLLVDRHVALTSTLPVFEGFLPNRPPLTQRMRDVLAEETLASYVASRQQVVDSPESKLWPAIFRNGMAFERAFVQMGGHLMAGLDPTGNGSSMPGFGDQRGVQLLVEAGFTASQAIQIASANGAQFLGQFDRIGSVAPGKVADLVVARGDLSANINDIEQTTIVFKDGVGYDSAKLIAAVKGSLGLN